MKSVYNFGFTFSGGGARGFAHLGVLKAFEERGIKPDIISGTSSGSLAGVFYADGYNPDEIFQIFKSVKFRDIIATGFRHGGFFKTTGLQSIVTKHISAKRFEELKIPLKVIASNIEDGISHCFSEGELIPAVIASCTVPIIFAPTEINGNYFVDGGMFANFPVTAIRGECRKIIGVNVSPVIKMKYDKSLKYIIERTMNHMVGANTLEDIKQCDYLITSDELSHYSLFEMNKAEEIYVKGYNLANAFLEKNRKKIARDLKKVKNKQ